MAERIVSLDNSPRSTVTLEIAGQFFTIRRVVTGAQQLWTAFVRESMEYLEKIELYQKDAAKAKGEKELARLTEEISREIDAFADSKLDRLLGILELLLSKNGYAFERQWWIDNAGEADYREFITAAMMKDQEPDAAKKNGNGDRSDGTA